MKDKEAHALLQALETVLMQNVTLTTVVSIMLHHHPNRDQVKLALRIQAQASSHPAAEQTFRTVLEQAGLA